MTVFSCLLVGNEPLTLDCGKRLLAAGHRIMGVATTRPAVADWARDAGLEVLEGAFRFPSGRLVEIGNGEIDELVSGFQSANGITRLEDGTLVIGELVGRRISVLAPIEQVKNRTRYTIEKRISLPFAVDNLSSLD